VIRHLINAQSMTDGNTYEGWTAVFQSGTDYEADIVRDRLDDAGIPAVVLTQRDHAFNLTVGDLSPVNVMVPPTHTEQALALLQSQPFTDAELDEAAMSADPNAPPAHDARREAMLDSGGEGISFSVPEDDDEDAPTP
jgi:hypothetical protein